MRPGDAAVREHFAQSPVVLDFSRTYRQPDRPFPFGKPSGLWYSVAGPDDWPSWCRAEDFLVEELEYVHALDLDMDRILRVCDPVALSAFSERYEARSSPVAPYSVAVDWPAVGETWAGIEIAPYLWPSVRFSGSCGWYSGWDCASGCVWDLGAVKRFELVRSGSP